MGKISLMAPGIWQITDGEGGFVSVYYIQGEKRSFFIDGGAGMLDFAALTAKFGGAEPDMLITHADADHIHGCSNFSGKMYLHPLDAPLFAKVQPNIQPLTLEHGQVFDLGNRKLEVIALGGHTPGSCAFLDRENRILFGGDMVQMNTPIFLFGQGRDIPEYIHYLDKLLSYGDSFDYIYPGHGRAPLQPSDIPQIIECCRLFLDGKLVGGEPGRDLPCLLYQHGDVQLFV